MLFRLLDQKYTLRIPTSPEFLPPQIPPEFVAAPYSIRGSYALPDEMEELQPLEGELSDDERTDSWQTAQSRRSARNPRQSSRASQAMFKTAARTVPVISALPVVIIWLILQKNFLKVLFYVLMVLLNLNCLKNNMKLLVLFITLDVVISALNAL